MNTDSAAAGRVVVAGVRGDITTIIRNESHLPDSRPPLSKQILTGELDPEQLGARLTGYRRDTRTTTYSRTGGDHRWNKKGRISQIVKENGSGNPAAEKSRNYQQTHPHAQKVDGQAAKSVTQKNVQRFSGKIMLKPWTELRNALRCSILLTLLKELL